MTKVKSITNNIVSDNYIRLVIFKCIIATITVLSIYYMFLIGSITFNILARKSLENTARDMGSRVGTLELSYLSLSSSINQNLASNLGFVDANNTIIVTRTADRVAVR